jgi:putative membrane protein
VSTPRQWNRIGQTAALLGLGALLFAGRGEAAETHRRRPHFILTQATADPSGPGANTTLHAGDRQFVVESVENGRVEAELSGLAVSQATSSSIREFAQQLAGDYRQINTALETLARRKSVEVPLQPTSYSDRYRDLAQRTGAEFDRAFVRQIAVANAYALRLCEAAVANAKDTDVRDLAGSLLPVIRDHVNKTTELEKSL